MIGSARKHDRYDGRFANFFRYRPFSPGINGIITVKSALWWYNWDNNEIIVITTVKLKLSRDNWDYADIMAISPASWRLSRHFTFFHGSLVMRKDHPRTEIS
jgi:hypothetical protein